MNQYEYFSVYRLVISEPGSKTPVSDIELYRIFDHAIQTANALRTCLNNERIRIERLVVVDTQFISDLAMWIEQAENKNPNCQNKAELLHVLDSILPE